MGPGIGAHEEDSKVQPLRQQVEELDDDDETWLERLRRRKWGKFIFGDYDWSFLCMPTLPWSPARSPPPFYDKDAEISLLLALTMGLQHALAMVGGIIAPVIILTKSARFRPEEQQYLISAALILSGVTSLVQITQIKIPYTRYVLGTFCSVRQRSSMCPSAMATLRLCSCGGVACLVGDTCDICPGTLSGSCLTEREAYGRVLGTIFITSWLLVALSFAPRKFYTKVFPPIVTGPFIIIVGVNLVATGFSQWGGGTTCASQVLTSKVLCDGNGDVVLPFGDAHYIGLGLSVIAAILLVELFGSPFLRNSQVVIGLLVGMIVASTVHVTKCEGDECTEYRFVKYDKVHEAPWTTYLYRYTYPLGVYPPAILPMLVCAAVSILNGIGDVTATYEASRLDPSGPEFERSIQGTILADGFNSVFSSLSSMLPTNSYAQNNGVISLSGCASRRAGYGCVFWLIFLGTFSKFAALVLVIPDCVIGAMTTFLFATISVSGLQILNTQKEFTRRDRFIVTMALGIGFGVSVVPAWVNITGQAGYPNEGNLWPVDPNWSPAYRGLRDGIVQFLSNGYSACAVLATLLNLILPMDKNKSLYLPIS
ncbi:hypothetical protein R1flu_021036 [Riccia fluitans]|uniref:Xanthine/uracil permease n=1 Tax=Riccia fluitans TaxID=41844 RepID=A0ABD1ZNF1_9MARC